MARKFKMQTRLDKKCSMGPYEHPYTYTAQPRPAAIGQDLHPFFIPFVQLQYFGKWLGRRGGGGNFDQLHNWGSAEGHCLSWNELLAMVSYVTKKDKKNVKIRKITKKMWKYQTWQKEIRKLSRARPWNSYFVRVLSSVGIKGSRRQEQSTTWSNIAMVDESL